MRSALGGAVIDTVFQSGNYELSKKLLDAAALRQEAIASNMANAETPGYRRVDVSADFASQLRAQLSSAAPGASLLDVTPTLSVDNTARTVRPDGNSVDIEHEMLAMNKNSVEFSYLSDTVTWNIKQLKMAISGQVGG